MTLNPGKWKRGGYAGYVQQRAIATISAALRRAGTVAGAAKLLGLQRTYLHRLMRELGISTHGRQPLAGRATIVPYKRAIDQAARDAVIHALTVEGGNRTRAARRLGIGRLAMQRAIQRYGLSRRFPRQWGGDFR